jgi:type IV secretory pathway VirB2 component (pilin)
MCFQTTNPLNKLSISQGIIMRKIKSAVAAAALVALVPIAARAQVGGGTDPATILNNIATFILGPFGQSVGILAIISAGFSWIFGYLGVYHVAAVVGGLVLIFGSSYLITTIAG